MAKKNNTKQAPMWALKKTTINELNLRYTSDRDVTPRPMADETLIPFDIQGTKAHVKQLSKIGILTVKESQKIIKSLNNCLKDYQKKTFHLDETLEDVHMNLEAYVSSPTQCGPELGGKMHTGRSRNDQAATAMRLYMRHACTELQKHLIELVDILIKKANEFKEVVMAGITHHQNAVLSTLGHLYASYAQALSRDILRLENAFIMINQSPLGAVAGYGTTWPLDRKFSALELSFDDVLENSIDCVTNRWEPEAELATAISFMMNHLSTISQDIIFLSTSANPALKLPTEFTTGSSVMPQKRNPDFAEATKGRTALIQGALNSLFSIGKGNVSGYNKDTQWTKYLIMDIVHTAKDAPQLFMEVINKTQPNIDRLTQQTKEGFLMATDLADALVRELKLPFRKAYLIIKEVTALGQNEINFSDFQQILKSHFPKLSFSEKLFNEIMNPHQLINLKKHVGAPSPKSLMSTLVKLKKNLEKNKTKLKSQLKKVGNI